MRNIFERGDFHQYSVEERYFSAVESRTEILLEHRVTSARTKVFLSHKHEDLAELMDFIGFLEKQYSVDAYIDCMDKKMPLNTCGKTATRIKQVIKSCDKFILLATDKAVEAPWCNWELGFGDAQKFRDNIAILPIKDKGASFYKGHEYMQIYPTIRYYNGSEEYKDGTKVAAGYYYAYYDDDDVLRIIPLKTWLNK